VADLAFVLVLRAVAPKAAQIVAAGRRYGLELVPHPAVAADESALAFDVPGGASMAVSLMPVPPPDVSRMPTGVTSPPPDLIGAARAHLVVAAFGLTGPARDRDTRMAMLAAAVVDAVEGADGGDVVGAMLGHGVAFHRAGVFTDAAKLAADEREPLPVEVAVDVTAAQESPTRMSFLTHGLRRYGREEELYVTCPIEGTGALGFAVSVSRWLLAQPQAQLTTGEAVGRTADEKVLVQRVADPTGHDGPDVIRLDLP
jgi:hypothetical protein